MPIANGLAWAALLDGSKEVTIAYFGDGASLNVRWHVAARVAFILHFGVCRATQPLRYRPGQRLSPRLSA